MRDDAAMCTRSTTNDFVVCFLPWRKKVKSALKKNKKKTTLICIDEIEEVVIYVTKTPYIRIPDAARVLNRLQDTANHQAGF